MADTDTKTSIPRPEEAQIASDAFAAQMDSDLQANGSGAKLVASATGEEHPRKRFKYPKEFISRKAAATNAASGSRSSLPPQPQPEDLGSELPPTNATSEHASADINSNENGIDDLSDLTSLSSDEQSSSSDIVIMMPTTTTALPKPFPMSVVEHSIPVMEASTSKSSRFKGSASKPSQSISASGPRRSRPNFKARDLDTYVWVLITPDTERLYDWDAEEGRGLWWPGKIQNSHTTDSLIEVKLFGKGMLHIPSPSGNILPQSSRSTKLKFKNPSYVTPHNVHRKKKQKGEYDSLKDMWQAAAEEMKSDMKSSTSTVTVENNVVYELTTTDDEDLPLYVKPNASFSKSIPVPQPTASQSQGTSKGAGGNRNRGKKRKRPTEDSENGESDLSDSWLVRKQEGDGGEADITLDIPGELLLARSKNQLNVYWPAKIEAYVRPSKPGLSGKYTVIFLDGTREDIPRNWFYTMAESGFAVCKLGTFISKDPQASRDIDDDDDVEEEEDRSSPVPQDPPPLREDFLELPIAQQFIYTKNILRAILEDRYGPSRQKHDDFVKGGKSRKKVTNSAPLRGLMNTMDVERLHKIVNRWCMKNHPADDDVPEPVAATQDTPRNDQEIGPVDSTTTTTSKPVLDEPTRQDIVMQEPSIVNDPPEKIDLNDLIEYSTGETRLTDYILPESAIRFGSPSHTDKFASSPPPEMPPSSNPISAFEYPSSQPDIQSILPIHTVSSPPPSTFVPSVIAAETSSSDDAEGDSSDLTPVEEEDELTIDLGAPRRVFVPFKSLGGLDKVEYCSNVLVPEAIRQILLWRTGERTQVDLLSPEQEELLYEKGHKLLIERDWVFDVTRIREKQLQNLKAVREKQERKKNGSSSRPKRNVAAPNYVE